MWSPAVTTVAPAAEPVQLADAKAFLRIDADDTTFDVELGGLITGVRDDVERITATRLITQAVELRADTFADLPALPIGPVSSVTELSYIDSAGAEQPLVLDTDFELFGAGLAQGLRPVVGGTWPAGAIRASSIRVTVVVGYGADGSALPQGLYVLLLRAIRAQFDGEAFDLEARLTNYRIWA